MFKKLSKFFKDSVSELKKVHWPTAKETKELTLSVITLAEVTSPYSVKNSLKSSSCTAKLKFET